MPPATIIPSFRYRDAHAAIDWLERVLGFTRHAVYPGENNTVMHAELQHGSGMIMLGSATNNSPYAQFLTTPADAGGRISSPIYLQVDNCDPLWAAAQQANAEVVQTLRSMDYGGRSFTLRDPEGYIWSVGEYDPWKAVKPATASEPATAAQPASNTA